MGLWWWWWFCRGGGGERGYHNVIVKQAIGVLSFFPSRARTSEAEEFLKSRDFFTRRSTAMCELCAVEGLKYDSQSCDRRVSGPMAAAMDRANKEDSLI